MKLSICSNAHQEIAMQFNDIRRFLSSLIPHFAESQSPVPGASRAEADASAASAFDFEPSWHGDHWQNLLSSPMDARRYVMEDWNASTANEWWNADTTASAH
ncbi:MAG: FIG00454466: hypothetical protein [uncultured Paraburkholderia sp.]|nr:MAG: FIG00454466: hypothetical protein [uncultured Paraburkholderia sp.]